MSDQFITLLIQVPLVGIFAWFVLHSTRQNQDFMNKRDEAWTTMMKDQNTQWRTTMDEMKKTLNELAKQVKRNTSAVLISARRGDTGEIAKDVLVEIQGE